MFTPSTQFYRSHDSSYIPSSISGLQLWLDANDVNALYDDNLNISTNKTSIQEWKDKSGKNNHVTQTTTANQPVLIKNIQNGKSVVEFEGSGTTGLTTGTNTPWNFLHQAKGEIVFVGRAGTGNYTSDRTNNTTQSHTIISTALQDTNAGIRYSLTNKIGTIDYYNSTELEIFRGTGSTFTAMFNRSYLYNPSEFLIQNMSIDVSQTSTSRISAFVNNINLINKSDAGGLAFSSSNASNNLYVGRVTSGLGNYQFYGQMCELLIYNRNFTPNERSLLYTYLRDKWGIGTPSTISNLELWLDASDLDTLYTSGNFVNPTTNGQIITAWQDKSGNERHMTQKTTTLAPIFSANVLNDRPGIRFDGTGKFLSGGTTSSFNFLHQDVGEVFIVAKYGDINEPNDTYTIISTAPYSTPVDGVRFQYDTSSGQIQNLAGIAWAGSGTGSHVYRTTDKTAANFCLSGNTFAIAWFGIDCNTNTYNNRLSVVVNNNGIVYQGNTSTGSTNANAGGILHIGKEQPGNTSPYPGTFLNGIISEIIIYSKRLTDTERETVYNYLKDKWYTYPSPRDISGLQLWLDASDVQTLSSPTGGLQLTNGGDIYAWFDKSGQNNHLVQTTAANRPTLSTNNINDLNVASFNGTTDFFQLTSAKSSSNFTFLHNTSSTIFTLTKPTKSTGLINPIITTGAIQSNTNGFAITLSNGTSAISLSAANSTATYPLLYISNGPLWELNQYLIATAATNLTTSTAVDRSTTYYNISSLPNTNSSTSLPNGGSPTETLQVGRLSSSVSSAPSGYFEGEIAELIVYNKVLNSSEISFIHNYLNNKRGIYTINPPFDVGDLELWLDASDTSTLLDSRTGSSIVNNGDSIGCWKDKSVNKRDFIQNINSIRPTLSISNNKNGVRFASSNTQFLTCLSDTANNQFNFLHSSQATVVAVISANTILSFNTILATSTNANIGCYIALDNRTGNPGENYTFQANTMNTTGTTDLVIGILQDNAYIPNTTNIFAVEIDNTVSSSLRSTLRVNSNKLNATNSQNGTSSSTNAHVTARIGQYPNFSTAPFYANIIMFELLVFSRRLTATEYSNVRDYLNKKWSVY